MNKPSENKNKNKTTKHETDIEYCYKSILNTINEGVMLTSTDGHVLYYNAQLSSLEGLHSEDVIDKKITDIYKITEGESEHHIVQSTGMAIVDRYQRYIAANKKSVHTVASTYPVIKNGKVIASYSIARNVEWITELLKNTKQHEGGPYVDFSRVAENNTRFTFDHFITDNILMKQVLSKAAKIAQFGGNVIIYGESGTGKELIAQGIHNENTISKHQPFIALNCSAIPETLLESILFGTTKGAYTGAENRKGLIEEAGVGTLFLDEINSMPLSLQAKLLRVIQEQSYRAVGGVEILNMRCRIISSTNIHPDQCCETGVLRKDLYYRLAVHVLEVPSLKQRPEDIRALCAHFVSKYRSKYGLFNLNIGDDVVDALSNYDFPGNVRELENIIESALTQTEPDGQICLHHLPSKFLLQENFDAPSQTDLKSYLQEAERSKILEVLKSKDWNISASAQMLGIARQNLQYRIKKLGIQKQKSHANW